MRGKVQFRAFCFDVESGQLYQGTEPIALQPLPTQLLQLFLDRPNTLISREEIHEALWTDRVVEYEQSLNFCVRSLRRALGDDASHPLYIETVPRRGYRFVAPVEPYDEEVQPHAHTPQRSIERYAGLALVAGLLVALLVFVATGDRAPVGTAIAEDPVVAPDAQENYRKARYLLDQDDPNSWQTAVPYLERALALEPDYADAHAALAVVHYRLHVTTESDRMDRVRIEVRNALASAPDHPEAHLVAAFVAMFHDFDLLTAEMHFQKNLAGDASNGPALHNAPLVAAMRGNLPRALGYIDTYARSHPGEAIVTAHAGWFRLLAGDIPTARRQCEESVRLNPQWRMGLECAATAARLLGDEAAAADYYGLLRAALTDESPTPIRRDAFYPWLDEYLAANEPDQLFERARVAALLDDEERVRQWVMQMADERRSQLLMTLIFPEFDRYRGRDWFWQVMDEAGVVGAEPVPTLGLPI